MESAYSWEQGASTYSGMSGCKSGVITTYSLGIGPISVGWPANMRDSYEFDSQTCELGWSSGWVRCH